MTKKVKAVLLYLFNLITILCTCISIITLRYDPVSSLIDLLYKEKVSNVVLMPDNEMKIWKYPTSEWKYQFTEDQVKILSCYLPNGIRIPAYKGVTASASAAADHFLYYRNVPFDVDEIDTMDAFLWKYKGPFDGIIELSENELSYCGFELDSRIQNPSICHLPVKDDKLAISSFKADMFMEYGYREDDGTIIKIESIIDLIGKKMDGYRITAIYDMKEDYSTFRKLASYDKNNGREKRLNRAYHSSTFLSNYVIMRDGLLRERNRTTSFRLGYVYSLPENPSEMRELIKNLTYEKKARNTILYYNVKIHSPLSGYGTIVEVEKYGPYHITLLITTLVFVFTDIILLSIFFARIFSKKNLSSLQNSQDYNDVNMKFLPLLSSLLFFSLALLLSALPTWLFCILFNHHFFYSFLFYDFLSFLYALVFCLFLGLLCLMPTYLRLTKKDKID